MFSSSSGYFCNYSINTTGEGLNLLSQFIVLAKMNKLFKICCITDCRAHEIEKENKTIRFSSSRSRIVDHQNRSLERRVKSSLPVKIRATNPLDIAQVTHAGQIYILG